MLGRSESRVIFIKMFISLAVQAVHLLRVSEVRKAPGARHQLGAAVLSAEGTWACVPHMWHTVAMATSTCHRACAGLH